MPKSKVKCTSIINLENGNKVVNLNAIKKDTKDNSDFTKNAPAATFKVQIDKDSIAFDFFKKDGIYNIEFTEEEVKSEN